MITFDLIAVKRLFFALISHIDPILFFKTVLCVSPLATGFILALRAVSGKKTGVGVLLPFSYLLLSFLFFLSAAGEDYGNPRYSFTTAYAAMAGAALFCIQLVVLICFVCSLKEDKPKKKKFVAYIRETPVSCDGEPEKKTYPIKALAAKKERGVEPDFEGFLKFLHKIGDEPLSFSDREEYNNIVNKAKFLSGVEINESTTPEFCSLFMRSIKLAARNTAE